VDTAGTWERGWLTYHVRVTPGSPGATRHKNKNPRA